MAKALVVEENQFKHMLKVAAVTGENRIRDIALIYALYGTATMPTEIASLQISDYLNADGSVLCDSQMRAEIAYNSKRRPLFWVNTKVVGAIDEYLALRLHLGHGITTRTAAYRGLDPEGSIFLRGDGLPFQLTKRTTPGGVISYSCDSLSQNYRRLHQQAGIVAGNAAAGRRSFAVWLHRKGFDIRHIHEALGHSTIKATKDLIDSDPIRLSDIIAGVI